MRKTGTTQNVSNTDLSTYALKSDLYAIKSDLENKIDASLKSNNNDLSTYALKSDLYAIKSDLENKIGVTLKYTNNNALVDDKISIGAVLAFCGDINIINIPKGFLPCDGKAYLKSQYPDLSRVLGSKFNKSDLKDPVLYFNVPDMRNMFMRGAEDDSKRGSTLPWKTALPQQFKILVETSGNHVHTLNNSGAHSHTYYKPFDRSDASQLQYPANNNDGDFALVNTSIAGDHTHSVNASGNHTHALTGGDNETCPVHLNMHFIIKAY